MLYRNRTYVCFDGDTDIHYYYLMRAWKKNNGTTFNFFDAHELNTARDTSLPESIKRQLRDRLGKSKLLVVLIGERTKYLYRFVRWEMEQALELDLPIIGVNLNGHRRQDEQRCPPVIRRELAIHVSFNPGILQYALEDWPRIHKLLRQQNRSGAYYYPRRVYITAVPQIVK